MSIITADVRRAHTRIAVLEFLAPRQKLKFEASSIRDRINSEKKLDFILDEDDVATALAFLRGVQPPLVEMSHPPLGSNQFYQVTTAGVLALERGDLE